MRFVHIIPVKHIKQLGWETNWSYLVFSPTYALIYIIKILSQAVILIAHFTPTCFDPYGSKHVGVHKLVKKLSEQKCTVQK